MFFSAEDRFDYTSRKGNFFQLTNCLLLFEPILSSNFLCKKKQIIPSHFFKLLTNLVYFTVELESVSKLYMPPSTLSTKGSAVITERWVVERESSGINNYRSVVGVEKGNWHERVDKYELRISTFLMVECVL